MLKKFIENKNKRILWGFVNNLDMCQSGWSREVAVNLTDFIIGRCSTYGYDIYISDNADEIISEATNQMYTHAVIVSTGTSFKMSERIFSLVEDICLKDFFIAGHIIHRGDESYFKNSYYELHHHFFIVNLAEYLDIYCPVIGQPSEEQHTLNEPIRSEEYLYNDPELPTWIKKGTNPKTYDRKLHGWNIINEGLENDKILIDIGPDIRNNKSYLYYEYDHVFLRHSEELYYNQFFGNNFVIPFNSDDLKDTIQFDGPVEQYITVGTGLNWVKNLLTIGYTPNTKVVFTDINQNCLRFMKAMVNDWDGEDYIEFYRSHLLFQLNNFPYDLEKYFPMWEEQWSIFKAKFDDWTTVWNNVRKLQFDFILIDYTASYNLNWIEPNKNTLANISDVFTHVPFVSMRPMKYRIACENRLISKLVEVDPNIMLMLTSRVADGFSSKESRQLYGKVKDFNLVDINLLTSPPWHKQDWNSPRILS